MTASDAGATQDGDGGERVSYEELLAAYEELIAVEMRIADAYERLLARYEALEVQ